MYPTDVRLSDHSLIVFKIDLPKVVSVKKMIEFNNYSNIDHQAISNWITSKMEYIDYTNSSVNKLVGDFNTLFSDMKVKFFPPIKKSIILRDDADWFDSSVTELRKVRRHAERQWRRLRTFESRNNYLESRRAVVLRIKLLKVQYYKTRVATCDGNQRKLWQVLNRLLGTKATPVLPSYNDSHDLTKIFADYFESKINIIRADLDSATQEEFSLQYLMYLLF
jgi:hypothetical protein